MRKRYYIVKSELGCFGAEGTVEQLPGYYTSKKKAEKAKPKSTKGCIYWVDFEWMEDKRCHD